MRSTDLPNHQHHYPSLAIKVGCDITRINRFEGMKPHLLEKLFSPSELKNKKPESLAGVFAAKESCRKVFNHLSWLDITIKKKREGKPVASLAKDKANKCGIISNDISISHDGGFAVAVAVFLVEGA